MLIIVRTSSAVSPPFTSHLRSCGVLVVTFGLSLVDVELCLSWQVVMILHAFVVNYNSHSQVFCLSFCASAFYSPDY